MPALSVLIHLTGPETSLCCQNGMAWPHLPILSLSRVRVALFRAYLLDAPPAVFVTPCRSVHPPRVSVENSADDFGR